MTDSPEMAQLKERAYGLWKSCRNLSAVHRRLNKDGYVISRQSLHKWKEDHDWENRAAKSEAEAAALADATSADAMIASLLKQKERYEAYLDSLSIGEVDTQAVYAFNGILKTIVQIQQACANDEPAIDRPALFLEDMQFIAEALKDIDPEALRSFGRNFDAIVDRFKAVMDA